MDANANLAQHRSSRADRESLRAEVIAGLSRRPRQLPPRLLYDARGSRLFEAITHLEDYYPTAAELDILERFADEIVELAAPEELVELGSGSSRKTRLLIEAALSRGCRTYRPLDVSESALEQATSALEAEYPDLDVQGILGDFADPLRGERGRGPRLVLFLGSTVGNLEPRERAEFLARLARSFGPRDRLLLGYDLVKGRAALERAYDDPAGVTAAFVRGGLLRLCELGGGAVRPGLFAYEAHWCEDLRRMEMRLTAREDLAVDLPRLEATLELRAGEFLVMEVSCKFTREGLGRELAAAGLKPLRTYADRGRRFELALIQRS